MAEKRAKRRQDKLHRLARMNKFRCDARPVYGSDLCEAVNIYTEAAGHSEAVHAHQPGHVWSGPGKRQIRAGTYQC